MNDNENTVIFLINELVNNKEAIEELRKNGLTAKKLEKIKNEVIKQAKELDNIPNILIQEENWERIIKESFEMYALTPKSEIYPTVSRNKIQKRYIDLASSYVKKAIQDNCPEYIPSEYELNNGYNSKDNYYDLYEDDDLKLQ